MEITNFTENDFISTLVFGAGGIILFYFLPIAIFSYFYLQFRSANSDVTIEGFTGRFLFYSLIAIVTGGLIFSLLSSFSFSSVTNASKGLAYFFSIDFSNFQDMYSQLKNNENLLNSEKDLIKYLLLFLGVLTILFKTLSLTPIILSSYLLFVNVFKCIKKQDMGENFSVCFVKKSFYLLVFLIEIYIVFKFADEMVKYIITNYTDINADEIIVGIIDTLKNEFVKIKTLISIKFFGSNANTLDTNLTF
jgi:hypothetical protein